jgi:hypothetical protein
MNDTGDVPGKSVLNRMTTRQFMYPKVTPISAATGPHRPQGTPSGTRRGPAAAGR